MMRLTILTGVLLLAVSLWAEGPISLEEMSETPPARAASQPAADAATETPATQPAAEEGDLTVILADPDFVEPAPTPTTQEMEESLAKRLEEKRISRMLLQERRVPVTPMTGVHGATDDSQKIAPPKRWRAPAGRLKEGHMVIQRLGHLRIPKTPASQPTSDRKPNMSSRPWPVMTFVDEKGKFTEPDRRVIPNRLLAAIEEIAAADPKTMFRVSGETTIHDGQAYLVLRRVVIVDDADTDAIARSADWRRREAIKKAREAKVAANPKTSSTAPSKTETGTPGYSTDALIEAMLRGRGGRAVLTPSAPKRVAKENEKSVAPAGKTPLSVYHGAVVDRIVRIVPEAKGPWWEVRFESDNTLREPPLRILPNGFLTKAQGMYNRVGMRDAKLRVTGDIYYYKGRRYLHIRKLMVERDLGKF